MTTKEYLTHWNHSRRGKVVIDYDATGGVVAVRVHLANERLVDRVHSKQHAKEHLGLRSYTKRDDGQLRMERFPDGKAPEGEGWEASQTDEEFAAAQEEYAALVADDSIPTLQEGEWKCEGYPWYWREAGLEWDGKDIANVFVGCSPPTKSTIFSAGHGQQFDGNSVLLQRRKDEHGVVRCVCVSGAMPTETGWLKEIVVQCNTLEGREIREYVSPLGNNDVPYHYAIDTAGVYYFFLENMVALPTAALAAIIAHQKKTVTQEQAAAAATRAAAAAAADEGKEAADPDIQEDYMFEPYKDFLYRVTRTGFPSSFVQSILGSNTSANSIRSHPQGNQPSNSSDGNTAEQSAEEIKVEFDPCQYLCEYDMKPTPAEVFVVLPPQYGSVNSREIQFQYSYSGFDAMFQGVTDEQHEEAGQKILRLVFKEVTGTWSRGRRANYKELCRRDINREEYERVQREWSRIFGLRSLGAAKVPGVTVM